MLSLDQVTSLFCLAVAFGVCRTLPAMVKFYAWFKDCGLDLANHRGYGQSACKAYGLFGAPKLSVGATALSGGLFAACLIAVAVLPLSNAACVGLLCASLVFYHLYFSQLYCEAHVGAHVTVMVPPWTLASKLSSVRSMPGGTTVASQFGESVSLAARFSTIPTLMPTRVSTTMRKPVSLV